MYYGLTKQAVLPVSAAKIRKKVEGGKVKG